MAVAAASAELLDTNKQIERAVGSKLFGILLSIALTFILLFAVQLWTRPGSPMKYAAFLGFALMMGQSLKPLVAKLQDTNTLTRILAMTSGVFFGMMALGFYDNQNLLGFAPYLLAGLIGLLFARVFIYIFATPAEKEKALDWTRIFAVGLFAALTAFHMQVIKAGAKGCRAAKRAGMAPDYPSESLGLFLDFINLFSNLGRGGGD